MTAELDANGTLIIYPETPLEQFALKSWAEKYTKPGESTVSTSALIVHSEIRSW